MCLAFVYKVGPGKPIVINGVMFVITPISRVLSPEVTYLDVRLEVRING